MRGIESVWRIDDGFAVLCDCATTTEVHVQFKCEDGTISGSPPCGTVAPQEIAITCDGCGSTHWLTITPSEPKP
jgi:hypothetical protein